MNPSSGQVIVQKVLDVRPAAFDEKGSYALPDALKGQHFIGQVGLVSADGKAYVHIQPRGVYIPDFEYGPITGKIIVRKQHVELNGRYDKFPNLPRYKEIFVREIAQDGMPSVGMETFNTLNSAVVEHGQITGEDMDRLIKDPKFCGALKAVFEQAGFGTEFDSTEQEAKQEQDLAYAASNSTMLRRDYGSPRNDHHRRFETART